MINILHLGENLLQMLWGTTPMSFVTRSPHRLVVRTSRCGRDNPGSTPGVDIFARSFFWCRRCWHKLASRLHASRLHAIQANGHLHQLAQMLKASSRIMPCHMGT